MVNGFAGPLRPDSVGVEFDDERLVANAGLVLLATCRFHLNITFHNVTINGKKSVTAEITATGISSTRTGSESCGPASSTTGTYTGNLVFTGYADNSGVEGAQVNIEVT